MTKDMNFEPDEDEISRAATQRRPSGLPAEAESPPKQSMKLRLAAKKWPTAEEET